MQFQQPYGSVPGSFPPPRGTFAAMQQGYLGQLGRQPEPPNEGQSARTYGGGNGTGTFPVQTGHPTLMSRSPPAAKPHARPGAGELLKPTWAPGGYYGHGAQQSLAKRGFPRQSRQERSSCC
ncbi:unnamed protein product [Durusdinium trenchii]|uniref:Uncharacterized protein n=1 Tax=Durusdinium trenchii TaxID=1381693 RepID=A0ABP0SJN5_9DINO